MSDEKQSTGPGGDNLSTISSQYRTAAGLPARESDEPTTPGADVEREKRYEPEGGYGGKENANVSSLNATEQQRATQRDETAAARAERIEETGLSGGETATQAAIVTGEPMLDEKPAPGYTPEDDLSDEDKGE